MRIRRLASNRKLWAWILLFGSAAWIAYQASVAFYQIAWGTGAWMGEFSLKWAVFFFGFIGWNLLLAGAGMWAFFAPDSFNRFFAFWIRFRARLGAFRWIFAAIILLFPVYLLQYTLWGLVFSSPWLRLWLWGMSVLFAAAFASKDENLLWRARDFSGALLLSSVILAAGAAFSDVTSYPFSLFWSDGNRLWDYSLMFGRRLYNYPANLPLKALISPGRQFLWGIPFLLPHVTIFLARFWSALLYTLPYMILGWILLGKRKPRDLLWFGAGLFVFLFLFQGPIYTPLILAAILVAWAWKKPFWFAAVLSALAGYYAQASRSTWLVAPAMWIGMLEVADIRDWDSGIFPLSKWTRAFWLVFAGTLGGVFIPFGRAYLLSAAEKTPLEAATRSLHQPLLWYRLLPSDTYPLGVIPGLLVAILPLTILLLYWRRRGVWTPSFIQNAVYSFALLAFLAVGLVASTKIGGGSNLHNLDMFLVGMMFLAAIAWHQGGETWFRNGEAFSSGVRILLFFLLAVPAVQPLLAMSPRLSLSAEDLTRVKTLTDFVPYESPPIPSLPSPERVDAILSELRAQISSASERGEVLFIDQRQLLTFGYVPKIPLVPEYEKKWMMNEALSGNAAYFESYYQDLARHRFSLIVTETLKVNYKETEQGVFSEENDAWTKWVAEPTLCFYEPIETFKDVQIQLLVPKEDISSCARYLDP